VGCQGINSIRFSLREVESSDQVQLRRHVKAGGVRETCVDFLDVLAQDSKRTVEEGYYKWEPAKRLKAKDTA